MPPKTSAKNYSQKEMTEVVGVLEKAFYGPYIVKKELGDPETQEYWRQCTAKVNQALGTSVTVAHVKNVWKRCKEVAYTNKKYLSGTHTNGNLFEQIQTTLTLLDDLPERLRPSQSEQLKKQNIRIDYLTVQLEEEKVKSGQLVLQMAQLQAEMAKLTEGLKRVKVATGNDTVVIVSDESTTDESTSSLLEVSREG